MKLSTKLFSVIAAIAFVSACNNKGDADSNLKAKPQTKPSVIDVLNGKSHIQVLDIKYKALKADCKLAAIKSTKGQLHESAGVTPPPDQPPLTGNPPTVVPVENPTPDSLIYDLKAQATIDKELKEFIKSSLTTSIDEQTLKVDISISPVMFEEYLTLDINQKKYLLKHTPVLSYMYNYQLKRGDMLSTENGTGRIYEKIEAGKKVVSTKIGDDAYDFVLTCKSSREINNDNPDLAFEFESQWANIDCQSPKNDEEKAICSKVH
ncbi:hypothetical protein K2P97_09185 [bacterium]|nr:hypothetical protein [bacterium]